MVLLGAPRFWALSRPAPFPSLSFGHAPPTPRGAWGVGRGAWLLYFAFSNKPNACNACRCHRTRLSNRYAGFVSTRVQAGACKQARASRCVQAGMCKQARASRRVQAGMCKQARAQGLGLCDWWGVGAWNNITRDCSPKLQARKLEKIRETIRILDY
jgi:hypothetical protein